MHATASRCVRTRACRVTRAVAVVVVLLLSQVVVAAVDSTSATGALSHHCIHDRVASPLHTLPHIALTLSATQAPEQAATLRGARMAADESAPVSTRPVQIYLDYALQDACEDVGSRVPTYQGDTVINCTAADVLTSAKRAFMTSAVTRAAAFLTRALRTPPTARMQLPANVCGGPRTAAVSRADTDFVLVVTAVPGASADNTPVAWARACGTCGAACTAPHKPVVGMINLLPAAMTATTDADLYVHVVMHEMSHALGFTALMSTLSSYVDEDGVWQGSGGTIAGVYRPARGKAVQLVRTPRVLAAARRHLGCTSLDGVEVEDLGGEGSAGSHWKKRVFGDEALTGALTSGKIYYSSLTLAVFADAGFYDVDFAVAEDTSSWGYQRGCGFALDGCRALADAAPGGEFCFDDDGTDVQRCTYDRLSVGRCDVTHYKQPLQSQYRYFDNMRTGGSLAMMDYCPFVLSYSDSDCITGPADTALPKFQGSEFGPHSRCFVANTITSGLPVISKRDRGARCFPAACNAAGRLLLRIQGQTVYCPASGEAGWADTSALVGVHGEVQCPAAAVICARQNSSGVSDLPSPGAAHSALNFSADYDDDDEARRTSCATRAARCVMPAALQHHPVCGVLADKVLRCFGTDCAAPMMRWLTTPPPLESRFPRAVADALRTASCGAAGRLSRGRQAGDALAQSCLDGERGAHALCGLFTDSATTIAQTSNRLLLAIALALVLLTSLA